MDPSERRYLEDENIPIKKTMMGTALGFVAGTIYGKIVATWHDVPRVEKNIALPGRLRTLRMMGSYGMAYAAIGGVYIGVEQLVENYRMKRDFVNIAIGGFVVGASVCCYRVRRISTAISYGTACAVTSSLIDIGCQMTGIDSGKEYYPYTTKKRSSADA